MRRDLANDEPRHSGRPRFLPPPYSMLAAEAAAARGMERACAEPFRLRIRTLNSKLDFACARPVRDGRSSSFAITLEWLFFVIVGMVARRRRGTETPKAVPK
jgi:hypothetical protein